MAPSPRELRRVGRETGSGLRGEVGLVQRALSAADAGSDGPRGSQLERLLRVSCMTSVRRSQGLGFVDARVSAQRLPVCIAVAGPHHDRHVCGQLGHSCGRACWPVMRGITWSRRMRSGRRSGAIRTAWWPSAASPMTRQWPSLSSSTRTAERVCAGQQNRQATGRRVVPVLSSCMAVCATTSVHPDRPCESRKPVVDPRARSGTPDDWATDSARSVYVRPFRR